MNSRTIRGSSDTIGLFPFLAVLLSTMGALLVLLVVLAQKAKQQAAIRAVPQIHTTAQSLTTVADVAENGVHQLQQQLQQLHHHQQQLIKLRQQAEARQHDEQLRLSHLEEHSRRLEHKLAKLQVASQHLQATEEKQVVDQEQAERELARLKELIEDNSQEVDWLRQQSVGKRSYAIIPYRGPQGTIRRPIYLECNKDGVVIQPEGIRLTAKDFLIRFDSGNPLAKALRAARDLLNTRAAKAGESVPPDPYPLLVVRPDGIQQYLAARTAIKSWDVDFGYEFIDQQWTLQYPESDPELAQVMRHAVMQGRERAAMLIQNAPRRYGRLGISTLRSQGDSSGYHSSGELHGHNGWGTGQQQIDASTAAANFGPASGNGVNGFAQSSAETDELHRQEAAYNDFEPAAPMGNSLAGQGIGGAGMNEDSAPSTYRSSGNLAHAPMESREENGEFVPAGSGDAPSSSNSQSIFAHGAGSERAGQVAASRDRGGKLGSAGSPPSATGGSESGAAASGSNGGNRYGGVTAQASGAVHLSGSSADSVASAGGNHWAIQSSQRGAVPIRRPIHVVIRKDRIAILRSRHTGKDLAYDGSVILLNQPTEQVMDEFATALREHMNQWGLAGNGLYWRPVLQLNIGPQGEQQAARLTRLLKGSGVEIGAPRTARQNQEVPAHVTK